MLHLHHHGIGACGTYPSDIAAAKVAQVLKFVRARQHPPHPVAATVRL
jgi:ATP-dependent Clp protease adaptor protein ClpS